jgi:hypothetical protein
MELRCQGEIRIARREQLLRWMQAKVQAKIHRDGGKNRMPVRRLPHPKDMQIKRDCKTFARTDYSGTGSERFDHDEDDDRDQRNRRHLVDDPEKPRRMSVAILAEGPPPTAKRKMVEGER